MLTHHASKLLKRRTGLAWRRSRSCSEVSGVFPALRKACQGGLNLWKLLTLLRQTDTGDWGISGLPYG